MTTDQIPPGAVEIQFGDPRYCWNPVRHEPHTFHYVYERPGEGTVKGNYVCYGDPEMAAKALHLHHADQAMKFVPGGREVPYGDIWPAGTIAVVDAGEYQSQEVWVASGANTGEWIALGGEYGRPQVAEDPRTEFEKMLSREHWQRPPGTIPRHPTFRDVLARGPVTIMVPGNRHMLRIGYQLGQRSLFEKIENLADDFLSPNEVLGLLYRHATLPSTTPQTTKEGDDA